MKLTRLLVASLLALPALVIAQTSAPRSAAIIVANRAGPEFDDKLPIVEDLITAKISELGLSVVSPEMVINAARALNPEAALSPRPTDSLEASLADSASVVRLAQGLNTDYILSASIIGFNEQKKTINAYDNQLTNYTYTLRLTYKLLDAQTGGSLTGGVAKAVRTEQNTLHVNTGVVEAPAGSASAPTSYAPPRRSAYNADDALIAAVRQYEKAVGVVAFALKNGRLVGNGTAWAVGPDTFATNAHVSGPVADVLAQGGAAYVVLNKHPETKLRITKAVSHPRYQSAGPAADGRAPFGLSYDVGVLKVDGKTDVWLPLASDEELKQVDSGYRVAFLGFPMEQLSGGGVNINSPVATMQSGIITSNTDWWMGKGDHATRLLVQHNLACTGGASGSPIFNPRGEVVALLNAGNIIGQVTMTPEGPSVTRAPSAALVNFGQRVDILRDFLGSTGVDTKPAGHSKHSMPAAPAPAAKPRVTFLDPDASAFVDDLLDDATTQIAGTLRASLASGRVAAPSATKDQSVTITLNVQVSGIQPPAVSVGADNTLVFGTAPAAIAAEKVDVQVDGVSVGTAPGQITLKKGFSNLRLVHPSLETWQRVVNAVDGQTLTATLRLTDEALARWQDYADYLYALEKDRKLTDAQVEVLRGKAQMLRQSGFKVDTKEAPKVETHETIIVK